MPSVSVPLAGQKGWDELMTRRRVWWRKEDRDQISKNFKASEFACHDGSLCPTTSRPGMVKLCRVFLEPMRAKFGTAYVLSGYRHTLYNARIGGAKNSQHIYENGFEAVAADMRFAKGTPAQWTTEAKKLRAKNGGKGGIGRYDRSGFIHMDCRSYSATWTG